MRILLRLVLPPLMVACSALAANAQTVATPAAPTQSVPVAPPSALRVAPPSVVPRPPVAAAPAAATPDATAPAATVADSAPAVVPGAAPAGPAAVPAPADVPPAAAAAPPAVPALAQPAPTEGQAAAPASVPTADSVPPAAPPAAQPVSAQPAAPAQPAAEAPAIAQPAPPAKAPTAQAPAAQAPAAPPPGEAPAQPPVAAPAQPAAPQQPILTDQLPTPPVAPGPGPVIVQPRAPAQDPNMPVGFDPRACPVLEAPFAPGEVPNPSEAWGGTDTGVVITGHARLRNPDPARPPARQMVGIDVSRYNTVNYDLKARCGTQFAFVRMDERYNGHAAEFEKRNIRPLPYFYMPVPREMRRPDQYARLTDTAATQADIDRLLGQFEQIGRQQAEAFFQRMAQLNMRELPLVVVRDQNGRIQAQARPIAVDIEEKLDPDPSGPNADNARIYYGRFYAKAVCTWVREVQARLREQQPLVVMYTTPSVWGDYLYAAYPAEAECLNALPIWVSRTTADGGDVIRSSRNRNDLYAARLCTASGANRCVVHQYSHRGQLGSAGPQPREAVPHYDLNRFFLVRPVQTGNTIMFVREQN